MTRFFLPIPMLLFAFSTYSQELSQVIFTGGATLSSFSFITDQQIIIKISADGKVIEWGTEWEPQRYNYYPGKLLPYMGRVEYYGPEYDSVLRGKIKSIGTCSLAYYGASEMDTKIGKLRSVGRVTLDYYSSYENAAYKGKLQYAGNVSFTYYPSYENEAYTGKLKSVNTTPITYYSTFDDKSIQGKVKSIGSVPYTWYSTNKGSIFQGTPQYTPAAQNINGVVYIVGY